MKMFTLSLFICFSLFAQAQAQSWCPPGAVWGYNFHSEMRGYVRFAFEKDTTVAGEPCVKLNSTGSVARIPVRYYTYERNDTVFFFYDNAFRPVYFFAAQLGDTLTSTNVNYFDGCGSQLRQVVDSVGTMVIDNDTLRYYVATYISDSTFTVYPSTIKVMEKFGALNNILLPVVVCNILCIDYSFRCYTDSAIHYYIGGDSTLACDYISTAINKVENEIYLSLHPNPANTQLNITIAGVTIIQYQILDCSGKQVIANTTTGDILQIDVSTLPQGIYLLKLELANGQYAAKRFIKQ